MLQFGLEFGMKGCIALACGALALAACGDDGGDEDPTGGTESSGSTTMSTSGDPTTDGTESTTTDATSTTTDATSTTEGGETEGTGTTGASACADEIAALSGSVTDDDGGCTVVVRLAYENQDILGWAAQCGTTGGTRLDADGARALTDCCTQTGNQLNPIEDDTFFVFSIDPADDGDVAVVSNHLQSLAFEATVIYQSTGSVVFPTAFEDETELASGCAPVDIPKTVTYDLNNGGQAIDQDDVEDVLDAIRDTALLGAMNSNGEVARAVVLLYPPEIPLVPGDSEYVVIIEGDQPR